MTQEPQNDKTRQELRMSNKQVIAIFIIGVGLLLGAFWAGLYVVKQNTDANTNQPQASARGAQPAAATKQPSANTNTLGQSTDRNTQYVVYIASFGTLEKAKQLEADLLKLNYRSAFVQMPTNQETLYRVNIGPYDKEDAEKVVMMLSNERKGLMILPWKPNL
jgi:cell division septation protein DedD